MTWQNGTSTRGEVPKAIVLRVRFRFKTLPDKTFENFPSAVDISSPSSSRSSSASSDDLLPSSSPPQPQSLRPHVASPHLPPPPAPLGSYSASLGPANSKIATAWFHDGVERTADAFVRHASSAAWLPLVDADVPWRSCISCLYAAECYRAYSKISPVPCTISPEG